VATGLHLLVQEGKVDLDEPITRWFADMPKAAQMPVRILLNHQSGLPDFETSMPMISDKVWKAEEIVAFAFKHGVQKEPWHGMEYSNTGYVLAGIIIARETGCPIPTTCASASSSHWRCGIPGLARMRIFRLIGRRAVTCTSIPTASRNGHTRGWRPG
jgi:hypothetical protein